MPKTFLGMTKPTVNTAGYLDDVIDATVEALGKYPKNSPPLFVYQRNRAPNDTFRSHAHLDYVMHLYNGRPRIVQGEIGTVLERLARCIRFHLNEHRVYPRREIAEFLMEQGPQSLPYVQAFQQGTYTASDGTEYTSDGYHPDIYTWIWTPDTRGVRNAVYPEPTDTNGD